MSTLNHTRLRIVPLALALVLAPCFSQAATININTGTTVSDLLDQTGDDFLIGNSGTGSLTIESTGTV
ncbi:MAG: hypothetical protein LBI02_08785, partial [Opitutaceae bacterium]|nr:hypothetical protein [Opitutaceae bacterium]